MMRTTWTLCVITSFLVGAVVFLGAMVVMQQQEINMMLDMFGKQIQINEKFYEQIKDLQNIKIEGEQDA